MKVLVCGDRKWKDEALLMRSLFSFHIRNKITAVIEGEAAGADSMSRDWALRRRIRLLRFPAQWEQYGRAAGPIRNNQMLTEGEPDVVLAFHNNLKRSRGTLHMIKEALRAKVPVTLYTQGGAYKFTTRSDLNQYLNPKTDLFNTAKEPR